MFNINNNHWYYWLVTVFLLVVGYGAGPVWNISTNMTKFNLLIEKETCSLQQGWKWFEYETIGSLFMWSNNLHLYYDPINTERKEWFYENKVDYRTEPIYGIKITDDKIRLRLKVDQNKDIMKKYLNSNSTTFFYSVDTKLAMFIFQNSNPSDMVLLYNYQQDELLQFGNIPKGSIPLLHFANDDKTKVKLTVEMPTTIINNRQFSYQTAWLTLEPVKIRVEHTWYYGFDHNLDRVYFAKEFKQLESIPNFVHPEKIVSGNVRWHPFRCYDYIYLVVSDWVFIFPHVNLTDKVFQKPGNIILQVSMTVMHQNIMFRCPEKDGKSNPTTTTVPKPTYPSKTITEKILQKKYLWFISPAAAVSLLVVLIFMIAIIVYWVVKRKSNKEEVLEKLKSNTEITKQSITKTSTAKTSETLDTTTNTGGSSGIVSVTLPLAGIVNTKANVTKKKMKKKKKKKKK